MIFEYKLTGLGWADGYIEIDKSECYFTASYLSNALNDFLDALLNIIPGCVPDDELKVSSSFEWEAEPAGTQWTLTRLEDGNIHVKVVFYSDLYLKFDPEIQVDSICSTNDFVNAVVKELEILIRTHGIIGYRKCWSNHDFPISSFLILKNFSLNNTHIEVTDYEHKGCQLVKTDLGDDIKLLLS
ncbi:hypothetical protein [Paenibacillus eucommiae]|uniref:Uncharacterized protein n=1 Tax=Paenibacillus eucommiae TaxID=1355755 RepID=A0ABS4J8W8_9BACL|nr:hypothetical protein [Paenibacillus eucommiae]MBP1995516.1 hypothetical protein [Paenibacillus eucommiae]